MKLISMTDYVLEQKANPNIDLQQKFINSVNYANFLKQPLELWMFVPTDKDGNVIEEPQRWNDYLEHPESFDGNKEWYEFYEYQEAKNRVLFEGFECKWWNEEKTILDLFLNDDKFYFYYVTDCFFASNYKNIEPPKTIEHLVKYNLNLLQQQ